MAKIGIHLSHKSLSLLPGALRGRPALEKIRSTVEEIMRPEWDDHEVGVDYQDPGSDSGKTVVDVTRTVHEWEEEELRREVAYFLPMQLDLAMERVDLEMLGVVIAEIYGDGWLLELADDLGVEERFVQSWVSGQRAVPGRVIAELPELLCIKATKFREKADGLCKLAAQLIADQAPVRSDGVVSDW